jgi:ATP-dependent DNA helicase RecQ
MPTGGGKSLTFQVPAMAAEGVCIVVTPLIALMKDQVDNLKHRGISAAAIYSGMSAREIMITLENCALEAYKFLYVAPERLATPVFIEKIKQTKVCIIAVDESHCISQWGYDFRPSYLRIADIRGILPNAPVLALTATATPEVVNDIQEKLLFREKNVFRKSFSRSNLAYVLRITENKDEQLLHILRRLPGTSVVYVRNRKKTKEIADFLVQNGITAEYFHAGLDDDTKDGRQKRWKNGDTRVIVSTNAFGMGIDKPDVRSVVHIDLPDSIEAYFQEAGRAGRDEKKAFAVLLYNGSDAAKLKKRIADTFPDKETVIKTYNSLCNYLEIGTGSGLDKAFAFDINDFCMKFHLPILISYNCLKILQQAGYIELTDEQDSSSQLIFNVDKEGLYKLHQSPFQEKLIHIILRSYTGLFSEFAYISEDLIARRLECTRQQVYEELTSMSKEKIITYIPRKKSPFIFFTREREKPEYVTITKEAYDERRNRYIARINGVLHYAQNGNICRSQVLLSYFGEKTAAPCGQCDICLSKKTGSGIGKEFAGIKAEIVKNLAQKPETVNILVKKLHFPEEKTLKVIRFMLDNGEIHENGKMHLELKGN